MLTRALDICIALFGLLILVLMLPVIGLLIKFDSEGHVFYGCNRVGKDGKIFKMLKFRTMYETPIPLGASVSPQGDPRVTPIGRFLRRTKLNEFPQFFNVLKGDMTLVGPRPESPDLAAAYPAEAQAIFSVKPGLVGPNQILGRNEEERYPQGVDPTKYYIQAILPSKLPTDLEYIRNKSFWLDLKYIFLAARETVTGAISWQHVRDNLSQISLLIADSMCCLLSFQLAFFLRFGEVLPFGHNPGDWKILPLLLVVRLPFLVYFGGYQTVIRYLGISDLKQLFLGVSLGSIALLIGAWVIDLPLAFYGRTVFGLDWLYLIFLLSGYRILIKSLQLRHDKQKRVKESEPHRALIWGAGDEGRWCLRYLSQNHPYEVVGFIDENPKMRNRRIDGRKVLGNHHHLDVLVRLHKIQDVFIAEPGISASQMERVQELQNRGSISLTRFVPHTIMRLTPVPKRVKLVPRSAG
ncbi:MAG: sugar transferase [Deltaproteobacteria bacterium]|nr:sugar transferase [Deltaproteobacteria bacterium]